MVKSLPSESAAGWVSLGRACKRLGVNESTLRRWADEGRIRSFRTPGGHRRFDGDDIEHLVSSSQARTKSGQDSESLGSLAVARIRRQIQQGKKHPAGWYSTVDEASRMRFRPLGRRLVALAADCLEKRMRGGRLNDEARAIGREYGQELARDGLALRDAVEAFTFFRRSLDETTRQLAHRSNLNVDETADAWQQITQLADVVLMALVDAFDNETHPSETAQQ